MNGKPKTESHSPDATRERSLGSAGSGAWPGGGTVQAVRGTRGAGGLWHLRIWAGLLLLFVGSASCDGQEWLDRVDDHLSLRSKDGFFQARLSGLLDLEGYYVDQRPPGLLFDDESFFNPRLSFFVDAKLGDHLYGLVQARLDRGFDPGMRDFEARLDEYLLRWTPVDSRLNLQAGKFATVVGGWVQRHDSWQNPLITAPLPYENLTSVSEGSVPASPAAFLARRKKPDQKDSWLPVIWGPVYATGGAVFGSVGKVDYALEAKNAALASHPYAWDPAKVQWDYPTVSGRVGFRPDPRWNHGLSLSAGPYLEADAAEDLPAGRGLAGYHEYTLDYDASYAWHRWQLWSEVFLTRFEVPNVGNADVLSYYLEAKYQLTTALFTGVRWNQQIFGTVADGAGGRSTWDNNMVRIDVALGYRFTRHLQAKIQYSYGHRDATLQQGEQLAAVQVTMRF